MVVLREDELYRAAEDGGQLPRGPPLRPPDPGFQPPDRRPVDIREPREFRGAQTADGAQDAQRSPRWRPAPFVGLRRCHDPLNFSHAGSLDAKRGLEMGLSDRLICSLEAHGAAVGPCWNSRKGTGLVGADRHQWKTRLVLTAVCDALVASDASEQWWECVQRVRRWETPEAVAAPYGLGKRRAPIAALLRHAASADDEKSSALAMLNSPRAYTKPCEEAGEPTPRAFRADFDLAVQQGALLIARRGARRCLVCACPLTRDPKKPPRSPNATADRRRTTWRSRRDYCQVHDPVRVDAKFPRREQSADRARQESIRVVFEWLALVNFRSVSLQDDLR